MTGTERFNSIKDNCLVDKNGCLIWQGSFQFSGKKRDVPYPNIGHRGKTWRGNRLVWTLVNGPIPEDKNVCHSCDNTKCLNPDHLWLGTHSENMQDKISKNRDHNLVKTHCSQGHPFSGDNLIIRKSGARSCRQCMRVFWNKFDAKNREARRVAALKRYYAKKETSLTRKEGNI